MPACSGAYSCGGVHSHVWLFQDCGAVSESSGDEEKVPGVFFVRTIHLTWLIIVLYCTVVLLDYLTFSSSGVSFCVFFVLLYYLCCLCCSW